MNQTRLIKKIGLEIHLQPKALSKAFSNDPNSATDFPNTQINPISVGLPGTLPALNKNLLHLALKLAIATQCEIPAEIIFDRKNYFYPDLPKGFQITQKRSPVGKNGLICYRHDNSKTKKINIQSVQIEEDSGKSFHFSDYSKIDYNRSGIPLIEFVTQPEFQNSDEAISFLKEFITIVKLLDISDCKMEAGNLRVDVNLSIEDTVRNVKILSEIKNINSIHNIKKAVLSETDVIQQMMDSKKISAKRTCKYDDEKNTVIVMREKETSSDYRYFPEPDIPPVRIGENEIFAIKSSISMLPLDKFNIYRNTFNLNDEHSNIISNNVLLSQLFDYLIVEKHSPQSIAKILVGPIQKNLDLLSNKRHELSIIAQNLRSLLNNIKNGSVSKSYAYQIYIPKILAQPHSCLKESTIKSETDNTISEDKIPELIKVFLLENVDLIEKISEGKVGLINFVVGKIISMIENDIDPKFVKNEVIRFIDIYKGK